MEMLLVGCVAAHLIFYAHPSSYSASLSDEVDKNTPFENIKAIFPP